MTNVMESSAIMTGSSAPVATPNHTLLALPAGEHLEIRRLPNLRVLRKIPWPFKSATLRWSTPPSSSDTSPAPAPSAESTPRYLLAYTPDEVRIWDLRVPSWSARLQNDHAAGKIVQAEFSGAVEEEVLTHFEFGSKVTVWSLSSRQSIELRDPKPVPRPWAFRPRTGQLAFLSRPGAADVLTLHAVGSYAVLGTAALASVDAQGVRWSVDGNWLAVWDAPSGGQSVEVHTPDGRLYRSWTSEEVDGSDGVGVRTLEWSPRGDYLAVGSYQRRVTLLGTKTFSPAVYLDHTAAIDLEGHGTAWQEHISGTLERSYTPLSQPFELPVSTPLHSDKTPKAGISKIAFNLPGTLIATRDDTAPTTVWIWNVATLRLVAVLVQHAPVRSLAWHPSLARYLLITSESDDAVLHIWDADAATPTVLPVPSFPTGAGRVDTAWLTNRQDDALAVLVRSARASLIAWPHGKGESTVAYEQQEEEADTSYDSVYEALVGQGGEGEEEETLHELGEEDTFHEQRLRKDMAATGGGEKVFGESDFF